MNKFLNLVKSKIRSITTAWSVLILISGILLVVSSVSLLPPVVKMKETKNIDSGTGVFERYHVAHDVFNGSLLGAYVYFEDHDSLYIEAKNYSDELEASLSTLENGDSLNFVFKSEDGAIIELYKGNELIYEDDFLEAPLPMSVSLTVIGVLAIALAITSFIIRPHGKKAKASAKETPVDMGAKNTEKHDYPSASEKKKEKGTLPFRFGEYEYQIELLLQRDHWIILKCKNAPNVEGIILFANLLHMIAAKANGGEWRGYISDEGLFRCKIQNIPSELTFQYDTLFSIVIEYGKMRPADAIAFLLEHSQIQIRVPTDHNKNCLDKTSILKYISLFEIEEFKNMSHGSSELCTFHKILLAFLHDFYKSDFVDHEYERITTGLVPFSHDKIETLTKPEVCASITSIVKGPYFAQDSIYSYINDGLLVALLKKLNKFLIEETK